MKLLRSLHPGLIWARLNRWLFEPLDVLDACSDRDADPNGLRRVVDPPKTYEDAMRRCCIAGPGIRGDFYCAVCDDQHVAAGQVEMCARKLPRKLPAAPASHTPGLLRNGFSGPGSQGWMTGSSDTPESACAPAPRPPRYNDFAHMVCYEAIDHYRRTHGDDALPRLHVSREAWDAITSDVHVADSRCIGVREYCGCPVTVSNLADRPGIWCDAMGYSHFAKVTEADRALLSELARLNRWIEEEPTTEAAREILAEFNGVELQQGAAAEQECAAATSLLAEYQRQARTWTGRQEDAR